MTLRADSVYRFFRSGDEETLAVRGVSLEIAPGELVVLSGPSGSGKSTLLACLAGTDEPSGGTVWVEGGRMSGRTEAARAALRARHIGTMAQSGNLLPHLSVADNLRLVRRIGGHRGGTGPILADLGISGRAAAWPHELSGGELARAALAVALVNEPAVLLADEPTGELDAVSEAHLLELLRARADRGCAILVASHSPAVRAAGDRVLRLDDGRLVA
ncbi:ABC transporter ATP-binding protein [Nocardioides sp. LS1]|uniref:ABC transporter ATP-binding protein n=1 Tax=Nocardioides sp. LS1 TaxID=1027620 RepID=UPI000F627351|nr:ATP-binding cassette domain-containing protein [Nocardioides sp. LS1]GCD91258.1 ABC transporter ATP-binding protein [Nocardioides sp. LS1]